MDERVMRKENDFNERFNKSLCDDEVEVPKEKLDFIPKLAPSLHLLEQCLDVLFDQNGSISHEIGVAPDLYVAYHRRNFEPSSINCKIWGVDECWRKQKKGQEGIPYYCW